MSMYTFPGNSTVMTLLAAVSAANTAAATGSAVDLRGYEGAVEITQCKGAGTGTLDGKIQDSADGSTDWQDVTGATFTQAGTGANTQAIALNANSVRRYIRYVGTIATGPQLVAVTAVGVPKSV